MPAIPRPFIAAGVAVVGTSAIALSPVTVAPPEVLAAPAIQLTASTDWADIFTRAGQSAQELFDTWREAPAPILQQIIANQASYLQELPDFGAIATQIQANLRAALAAPTAVNLSTLDPTHGTFYQLLPAVLQLPGASEVLKLVISPMGKQLLAISTSALSGLVLGMAGPVLGPLLALGSSLDAIRADLTAATPDVSGALNEIGGIPAAMTDAFLNGGQHVDLTALAKTFGPAIGVSFPAGVEVGIALGGLLSPGGSIFNALDFAYDNNVLGVLHIHIPLATGTGVGPIGAFMDLTRTIAKAIGWQAPASAAAARSSSTSSLAAANEVPRSVVSSETPTLTATVAPKATTSRTAKASAGAGAAKRNATTTKRPAAAGSGKGASGRPKAPAKAAAG